MKNKFLKLSVVALTVVAMTFGLSCKNDKPESGPEPSGRIAVNLTADIVSPSKLKVANDEWEPADKVGLTMKKAGIATLDALYEDAANVQMSIEGQKLTASPPVYYPTDGSVDFIAYYPYVPDASMGVGYTIDVNVAGQASGLPVETLYSNNVVEQAPTESAVTLNFTYSLAKLVVTVEEKANSYLTAGDFAGMTVSVDGMNTQAKLQLIDGTLTNYENEQAITLHPTESTATSAAFEALILPFEGEAVFVFTVGINTYRCVVDGSFAAATKYALTFQLDAPDPNRTVTLLNTVITPRTVTTLMYMVGDFITVNENLISNMQVDPLEKVFNRDVAITVENTAAAEVAKGETATFQFVLRSEHPITNLKIGALPLRSGAGQIPPSLRAFVRYTRFDSYNTNNQWHTLAYPEYPDCLWDEESLDVPANKNQPVWVEYRIPRNAAEGDYKAYLVFSGTMNGKQFAITKEVSAKVYPVVLPEQTLPVSTWFDNATSMTSLLNNGVDPGYNTPRYWDLMKVYANSMRDHGINETLFFNLGYTYGWLNVNTNQWVFSYTGLERYVDLFIREGGLKRIETQDVAGRIGTTNELGVFLYSHPSWQFVSLNDQRAKNWLTDFINSLTDFLDSKGWSDMLVLKIADEPPGGSGQSYRDIADFIKGINPNIKIIGSLLGEEYVNRNDIWYVGPHAFAGNQPFFQQRLAAGEEVWYCSYNNPLGDWTNRFVHIPTLRNRYMFWFIYRYKMTGYLHWAYNTRWNRFPAGNMIDYFPNRDPPGDEYLTYPGFGKVYESIRSKAQRDGIADYELLKLLEKTNSSKAQELATRLIIDFSEYDLNINNFRQARRELLEALSQ